MNLAEFYANPMVSGAITSNYGSDCPAADGVMFGPVTTRFDRVPLIIADCNRDGVHNGILYVHQGATSLAPSHPSSGYERLENFSFEIDSRTYYVWLRPDGMHPIGGMYGYRMEQRDRGRTTITIEARAQASMRKCRATEGDKYLLAHKQDGETIRALPTKKYDPTKTPWEQKGWVSLRPGRYFRAMYPTCPDGEIEELTNYWKGRYADPVLELVQGDKIRHWYHHENNIGDGSLGNSCMRHDDCQSYFGMYVENPNQISMLVSRKGDKINARALVWKLDDGRILMDRIYGSDASVEAFKLHAAAQGWWCKKRQSYDYHELLAPDGTIHPGEGVVTLDHAVFDRYPFLDTLQDWDQGTKRVSIQRIAGATVLNSTEGGDADDDYYWCERCDTRVHVDDVHFDGGDDPLCEGCYLAVYPQCDGCGERCDMHDMHELRNHEYCEECYMDRTFTCEECHNTLHTDEMRVLEGDCMCEECYDNKAFTCENCGEDFHVDNHDISDGFICRVCADVLDKAA